MTAVAAAFLVRSPRLLHSNSRNAIQPLLIDQRLDFLRHRAMPSFLVNSVMRARAGFRKR